MNDSLLLIEDDDVLRTFLADNLTADGFEMLVAGTLAEGKRLLETHAPAVALVDVELPDGSGLGLIAGVRDADARFARVDPAQRFLVLSGRGSELDRVRGLQQGADDYVVKPLSYPELLASLSSNRRFEQVLAFKYWVRVGAPPVRGQASRHLSHAHVVPRSGRQHGRVDAGRPAAWRMLSQRQEEAHDLLFEVELRAGNGWAPVGDTAWPAAGLSHPRRERHRHRPG